MKHSIASSLSAIAALSFTLLISASPALAVVTPPNHCWECYQVDASGRRSNSSTDLPRCIVAPVGDMTVVHPEGSAAWTLGACVENASGCTNMDPGRLYLSEGHCSVRSTATTGNVTLTPPGGTTAPSDAPTAPVTPPPPFHSINPNPSIPIPGVEFTPAIQNGTGVAIPFLAQYIGGIFRFAIGIGTILASIMVVYGGFRYLLSASVPDVKDGKQTISDAILGLVVLLGSYLILQTINPQLLTLRPLSLDYIRSSDIELDNDLNTTHGATGGTDFASAPAGSNPENCPFQDLPPGHIDCGGAAPQVACTAQHCTELGLPAGCHDSARCAKQNPPGERQCGSLDPRAVAFRERIGSFVHATDPGQRIQQIGQAAIDCQVHFGSCNGTAGIIRELAGYTTRAERVVAPHLDELRAAAGNVACDRSRAGRSCSAAPPGCAATADEAKARVRAMAHDLQDSRADMLRPGDWLYIYNGNNQDCGGQHSILFIGWDPTGKYGLVVQGQWGHLVRGGRVCLRTTCPGGNFAPITRIH